MLRKQTHIELEVWPSGHFTHLHNLTPLILTANQEWRDYFSIIFPPDSCIFPFCEQQSTPKTLVVFLLGMTQTSINKAKCRHNGNSNYLLPSICISCHREATSSANTLLMHVFIPAERLVWDCLLPFLRHGVPVSINHDIIQNMRPQLKQNTQAKPHGYLYLLVMTTA